MSLTTAFIHSQETIWHDTGFGHPEAPARIAAVLSAFKQAGITPPRLDPLPASREDLLRVHSAEHIDRIERMCANGDVYPDPDTPLVRASYDVARLTAGAGIAACKAVLNGQFRCVFSAMRPPGHHATRDRAMGFCIFNNAAIAARWLTDVARLERVAILDWDVHHGNGTQDIFWEDAQVMYVSLHEYPHYPGTGELHERGSNNTNLNLHLPPGAGEEEWLHQLYAHAIPAIERFAPDFLIISCGFDAHRLDPLSSQRLEADSYAKMTHMVKDIARGRIVSLLEGGYHLGALGASAVAHFQALAE